MGRIVSFTIPGKPSRWQRPVDVTTKNGRQVRLTAKAARDAGKVIAQLARIAWGPLPPPTGPVLLRVVAIFEIPPSWPAKVQAAARQARVMHISDSDLDNIIKIAKDSMIGIAYVDDNQVCGYPNSAKRYGTPARTEVTIEVLDQQEDEITPGQRRLEKREAEPPKAKIKRPTLGVNFASKTISNGGAKWR